MRTSVGRHQQRYVRMWMAYVFQQKHTEEINHDPRQCVVASGPGLASSSCVVTVSPRSNRQPRIALLARAGHCPLQLPSGDPRLSVIRPRVQRKPPRKAGTGLSTHLRSGGLLRTSSAGRG
ncbi:hypothetical protein ACQKWADRAFT_164593 [Trichoderma austrokoningii]